MRDDSAWPAISFPLSALVDARGGKATSAWLLVIALLFATMPGVARAAPTAAAQIDQAVEKYWCDTLAKEARARHWQGMRFTHKTTRAGSAAQLPACQQPLAVSGTGDNLTSRRLTVRCPDQPGWSEPVSSQANVRVQAVFAGQVIERGQTITAEQLKVQELDVGKAPRGFFSSPDAVAGKGAKRRIRANQLLDSSLLALPLLVRRGEEVKIVANRDGINATAQGQALEDGAQGTVIRVRNLGSNKTIDAQVIDTGIVTSTY